MVAKLSKDEMITVDIACRYPVFVGRQTMAGLYKRVSFRVSDVRTLIQGKAKVDRVLSNGKTIRLDFTNYDNDFEKEIEDKKKEDEAKLAAKIENDKKQAEAKAAQKKEEKPAESKKVEEASVEVKGVKETKEDVKAGEAPKAGYVKNPQKNKK